MKTVISLIAVLVLLALTAGTFHSDRFDPNRYFIAEVKQEGMMLCRHATPADSVTTDFVCTPLPRGAVIMIPQPDRNAVPDKQMKKASLQLHDLPQEIRAATL